MNLLRRLLWALGNRNLLFVSSIVLGIAVGDWAAYTQAWTLPALAVALTVSMTQVQSEAFRPLRKLLRPTWLSVLLNFVLQGAAILIPARLLLPEPELWVGFVIAAATPPGAAVIPFSGITGGDMTFSLLGTVGGYLASLVVTPAMLLLLAGESGVDALRLASILVQLVLVPLLASRLVLVSPLKEPIARWRGKIVNWAFTLVLFTIIGLNRDVFFSEPWLVFLIGLVNVIRSFGLAFVIDQVLKRWGVERPVRMSYLLMATLKNGGFASATALALFGERAAVPNGVAAAIAVPYLLWLGIRWGREGQA
jgi:BASS family bile acid:Na+ symporter